MNKVQVSDWLFYLLLAFGLVTICHDVTLVYLNGLYSSWRPYFDGSDGLDLDLLKYILAPFVALIAVMASHCARPKVS